MSLQTSEWVVIGSAIWWAGIGIAILIAFFFLLFAPKRQSKHFQIFCFYLGIFVFCNQALYWVLAWKDGIFSLAQSLPLHMCSLSQIGLLLGLTFKYKKVCLMLLFWGPIGGFLALLIPYFDQGIIYVLQYYIAHSLVAIVPVYLFQNKEIKLSKNYTWKVMGISNLIVIAIFFINNFLGSNYWYVNHIPPVHRVILSLTWLEYFVIAEVVFLCLLASLGRVYKYLN